MLPVKERGISPGMVTMYGLPKEQMKIDRMQKPIK